MATDRIDYTAIEESMRRITQDPFRSSFVTTEANQPSRRFNIDNPPGTLPGHTLGEGAAKKTVPSPEKAEAGSLAILTALIGVERSRCESKADPDERDDALANLVEGSPEVVARVSAGLQEYLSLLAGEGPPASPGVTPSHQGMALSESERGFIDFLRRHTGASRTDIQVMNSELRNRQECVLTLRITW